MTAVMGSRVAPSALLRLPGVDALAIDECVTAGLLRLAPPVFTFRHELVRQAVLSAIGDAQRRQLNGQVLDCPARPAGPTRTSWPGWPSWPRTPATPWP